MKHCIARIFTGVVALAASAGVAWAQLPPPGQAFQFDITGFLQEATVNGGAAAATPLTGGLLKVNGHLITVPSNTIVVFPANQLTWQETFAQAPFPYGTTGGNGQSGLALSDTPVPLTTAEVHVQGNVVNGVWIAGLVELAQQGTNSGNGYITAIDYVKGELQIANSAGTPVRVQINDPFGRFGRVVTSPDRRFVVDPDNPTIGSTTGYPMCLPRTDPAIIDDALCPQGNRPKSAGVFLGTFITQNLTNVNFPAFPGVFPDSTKQAPFEVGDYITYMGTLVQDFTPAQPTVGPWPGTANTYISAHTIENNIAVYTWPGSNPAYITTGVYILGVGGNTVIGGIEATIRTRFEGFMTDPSRSVHLYANDVAPDGTVSDRDWGTIGVDQGPPNGAVKGRWRFRPPCTGVAATTTTAGTVSDKVCSPPPDTTFLPATREMRVVIEQPANGAGVAPVLAWLFGETRTSANGIIWGQYHAPIAEYLFPEQIVGAPVPPANFDSMPFLACGGYSSTAGTLAGPLNPFPATTIPCAPVIVPPPGGAGADVITVTSAVYRTSKQRLVIQVSDSVVSPNVILTLQPYVTVTGSTFNPAVLGNVFVNQGAGVYLLDIVGAPEPAIPPARPLDVISNTGGNSLGFALTLVRQ